MTKHDDIAATTATKKAPKDAVVWVEIPVRDLDAGMEFYGKLLECDLKKIDGGPNQIADFPSDGGTSGHLYPGKPSLDQSGPTVHLNVPDLEAAQARCWAAGGTVFDTIIPLPVGRFCYAVDPDGNSIGLFEPK